MLSEPEIEGVETENVWLPAGAWKAINVPFARLPTGADDVLI